MFRMENAVISRCSTLNLEVGKQLGVMSRLPMNPLRPRRGADPSRHPQAPVRESR